MSTQTKTQTINSSFTANLSQLPMMKHFSEQEIATKVDNFRKGEKSIYWFLKLAAIVGVGYLVWTYVLPPVFQAIGQMLAVAATGIMIVFGIMVAPVVFKGLRTLTRAIHKAIIRYDPFAQFEVEREKMVQNQATFRVAKAGVGQLEQDMQLEAKKAEKDATEGQTRIITLEGKARKIKADMDAILQAKGAVEGKIDEDYVNLANQLQLTLAEANRVVNMTRQSQEFVQKYGTRAVIMKKLRQKLSLVETMMQIKLSDFDATVVMLKKDYEFGQKANAATTAAKSALGFSKGWEFDYALDVVTSTIASDIAITAGNLKDIETLTTNYNLDSDELFANLEQVTNKIKIGEDVVPSAKSYNNPDYKFTSDDRAASGKFTELF